MTVDAVPRIHVVGLGPAGPELITAEAEALLHGPDPVFLRTRVHPAAVGCDGAQSFDEIYEIGETFDRIYEAIVGRLVAEAESTGRVVYAVPGSPTVAERTVTLLGEHPAVAAGRLSVVVHPSVSFVDLACVRLGIDPIEAGIRLVDGASFAVGAAGQRGPLLVAQCWSPSVLSEIKLAVEVPPTGADGEVTVLHHLGLDDERVWTVAWEELDRSFVPDHLTSLWIPSMAAPVAAELVRLDELVRTLRVRCPWDREQTHGSLARHLLEESYEVLEAIDEVARVDAGTVGSELPADPDTEERAVAHLEEELGDLLFQVYFHAALAAEAGRFTLADVARGVHDKLVSRHPHVFGDVEAETPDTVATDWEALKKAEKNRSSVTEGIPANLPALAVAAKLQGKALSVGMVLPSVSDEVGRIADGMAVLAGAEDGQAPAGARGGHEQAAALGELLFSLTNVARSLGVDPETALRSRATRFRAAVEAMG